MCVCVCGAIWGKCCGGGGGVVWFISGGSFINVAMLFFVLFVCVWGRGSFGYTWRSRAVRVCGGVFASEIAKVKGFDAKSATEYREMCK